MRRVLAAFLVGAGCLVNPVAPRRTLDAQSATAARPASSPPAAVRTAIDQAFRAAYSLDESDAMTFAQQAVTIGPDEPSAHRALANILWLAILFKRGAVVSDQYLSANTNAQVTRPKPPPDLEAGFKREMARAIELAEARLRNDPRGVQAHYDTSTAYALQASYTASVDGSLLGAFKTARRAFDAAEFVLDNDPKRVDAGLIAGAYRYLVSTLSFPARFMAYVVGFGGGKARGIALVEGAAQSPDTHIDAKVALLLIYRREGRHLDALRTAHELEAEFPRNRLFTLEAGSAAIRAGRAAEAETTLTRGLAFFDQDTRPKIPGERAYWLYKRGLARIALNRLTDAKADLDLAAQGQPVEWVRGRIELERGKIADLTGRRADAVAAYQTAKSICGQHNDPDCADEAGRLLGKPFRF
jgi:tetratricopeptide (TPR) repeat protein